MRPHEVAIKYLGQTEKAGNMGFNDGAFEEKMRAVGFQDSHAWCAYFSELVFKEAIPDNQDLDRLFSASAVQTFENFAKAGYPVSMQPAIDTLVVWQSHKEGLPLRTGHVGVVCSVNEKDIGVFESVEGNTNDKGGREGYIVARRPHRVNPGVQTGLRILGFITIKSDVPHE